MWNAQHVEAYGLIFKLFVRVEECPQISINVLNYDKAKIGMCIRSKYMGQLYHGPLKTKQDT